MNILNKLVSLFMLRNEVTGKKSYTVTMTVVGFGVICIKLLISGMTIGEYKSSDFTGVDFAAALGAISALYVSNKHVNNLKDKNSKEPTDNA